jgi:hypothetical protein
MLRIAGIASIIAMFLATSGCGGSSTGSNPLSSPSPRFSIVPSTASVAAGATYSFVSPTASGVPNPAVSWSVLEGAAGGTVTSAGLYTAPAMPGTYHVVATSTLDKSKNATATITVPVVSVVISPSSDTLGGGDTRTFVSMTTTGIANPVVNWEVQEGPSGGNITRAGTYTAPTALGTYHVVAISLLDTTKTATASVAVVQSGFSSAATIPVPRGAHTATLLPSGKVLIAGGTSLSDPDFVVGTMDAELYDPLTGSFVATGGMRTARYQHTATLLLNGKVLVTGGFVRVGVSGLSGDVEATDKSEVYDPSTGLFTSTGTMRIARGAHTATLLSDGRVLVTGGGTLGGNFFSFFGSALDSAEIYDPETGSFTLTGTMSLRRYIHTATLLGNGKVLITGGAANDSLVALQALVLVVDAAELYDPSIGAFTAAGNMRHARGGHSATLLPDGRVLISGGFTDLLSTSVSDGGYTGSAATSSCELFDANTGVFTDSGPMTTPRAIHTATLLPNGQVLLAGGVTGLSGPLTPTAELYDPTMDSFIDTGGLATARDEHSATLLPNGRVLVIGGDELGDVLNGTRPLSTEEVYH